MELIERVQYKAALIVSGCWQGTSRIKLYEELGWESLSDRRWARRLIVFYKIKNGLTPLYLSEHVPERTEISLRLRRRVANTSFVRTARYENSFFPYTIKEWKNLDDDIKSKPSVASCKRHINEFIRPPGLSFFGIQDIPGTKLLTKIRVSFSDLREHRFNHNFNCGSPICSCGIEEESSVHFFLRCPRYSTHRSLLLSKVSDIIGFDASIFPDEHLHSILIYGSNVFNNISNALILSATISYIRSSRRFSKLEAFE